MKIVKELTGAQVLVHKREASYVGKGVSADVKPLNLRNKILIKFLPKSLIFFDPVEPDIIIHGFPFRLRPGLPIIAQDIDKVISSWETIIEEGVITFHSSHSKSLTNEKMKKILKKKRGAS